MRNSLRLETICAAGLIIFFFLPWGQILGFSISGYNLGEIGSYANLVWLIPLFSIILIVMALTGKNLKLIAALTGLLPIIGLLYGIVEVGGDLFQVLGIGVYSTILAGVALLLTALGVIKSTSSPRT